jgi:fructose-1,6-bisphosphatase I
LQSSSHSLERTNMEQASQEIGNAVTLTQFILRDMRTHPEATGQLTILLHAIEIASKYVSSKVRAAGLFSLYGVEGSTNVQGEVVKKLDVVANDAFITALTRSNIVRIMVSEENTDPIVVTDASGHYAAVFDPLDGSSNIDANVSIGTIFGIYRTHSSEKLEANLQDVLQPGKNMVAAGYCMYGSATIMVLTTGNGVNGFTLDPSTGEFVLTHSNIKTPNKKNIYSINEGYSKFWLEPVAQYISKIKNPENDKDVYSQRYVGSMVADVHRTLLYGGIFMYPGDKRDPSGKLRLLYEANPMSMILEQAGGKASTGTGRVLDIVPQKIHQRVPIFLGSVANVEELEAYFKNSNSN